MSPGGSDGKASACNVGDLSSIPGLGRSPGEGNGNPLQYSCLENPQGQRSLAGYSRGHKELDTKVRPTFTVKKKISLKNHTAFMVFKAKIWERYYQCLSGKMYTRVTSFSVLIDTDHYYCR